MSEAIRKPKKGAGRKWASRLEELGKRKPPEDLVKKINDPNHKKKVAKPIDKQQGIEL